jgi:phosphopantothenoylcysteine decarboxylase
MADATPTITSAAPTNSLAELTASRNDGKAHLLLAASGSVATIKIPNIIAALTKAHPPPTLSIRLILSSSASNFLAGQSAEQPDLHSLLATPGLDGIYQDDDEWGRGPTVGPAEGVWRRGGSILHIELRRWADVMAIVPLSANTLAKVVGGICDNLLTSVVRAWDADGRVDGRKKRILVAPAMNVSAPALPAYLPHEPGVVTQAGKNTLGLTVRADGNVAAPHNSKAYPRAGRRLGRRRGSRRDDRLGLV